MADTLKVFTNQTNQIATASLSTVSIPLASTNSSTRAVIKDVGVEIRNTNSKYLTTYNYPTKLKVNGATVSSNAVGRSSIYSGNLVLDTSTNLTLEIQAEDQKIDYGTLRIMIPNSSNANTYYEAKVESNPSGRALAFAQEIEAGRVAAGGGTISANTATGFFKNGVPYVAYADNSSTVKIIDTSGVNVASVAMGVTTTAVASDGTYIYTHGSSATSHIKRILISNFTKTSNLSLNGSFPGFGTSNPGWIDHYDGHVYMRHSGSASEVYKANTSSGTLINFNTGHNNETEHLGGRITVDSNGDAYIVEWQDKRFFAYNLDTNTLTSQPTATSVLSGSWTEPTTTSGNHSATVAAGIVLFLNRTYNQCAMVDINSGSPTGINVSSDLLTGSGATNVLMCGWPQQDGPISISRTIQYDTYVGGVEVT